MDYLSFLKTNLRWLGAGALLTFASTFGQTYFIALFGGQIRESFSLTHGEFGFVYMIATLASAATLVQLGQLADHMRLKTLGLATIFALAFACFSMGFANSWIWLVATLYILRLFGQGMMGHVATTAMARWFNAHRGRALGIASLGHAAGEAALPGLAVLLIVYAGWRETWLISGAIIILVLAPVFWWLTTHERAVSAEDTSEQDDTSGPHWTRSQVLADPLFYVILPGMLAPAFIVTVTFFHQAHLVEVKGWNFAMWAGFFPFFAGAATVMSLVAGWAVDKWSARALLPVYLLPMAASMLIFASGQSLTSGLMGMIAIGCTIGMAQTVSTALWAEVYGTRFLGTIKALTAGMTVFATAIGPGGTGWLMDNGVSIEQILIGLAVYSLAMSGVFAMVMPWILKKRQPGGH